VLLALGRTEDARRQAEQAWERQQRGDMPPQERAGGTFLLARAYWAIGGPAHQTRAVDLAAQAMTEFARLETGGEAAEQVRAWLRQHKPRASSAPDEH
jgi:hypothetical protein